MFVYKKERAKIQIVSSTRSTPPDPWPPRPAWRFWNTRAAHFPGRRPGLQRLRRGSAGKLADIVKEMPTRIAKINGNAAIKDIVR